MTTNNAGPHEHAAACVLRWAAIYTRGLTAEVAQTRVDELASDLYEHGAVAGTSHKEQRKMAREIMLRAFRGLGSDVFWREHQLRQSHNRNAARLPVSLSDAELPPIQSKATPGCTAESQSLLALLNEALVAAKSADDLLAVADSEGRPESEDARLGLHLRFTFVNLQQSLAELKCCPEHVVIQHEAATLLVFYLHMITRSFEVRYSLLARDQYVVLAHDPEKLTTLSRLMDLRNVLQGSLNVIDA